MASAARAGGRRVPRSRSDAGAPLLAAGRDQHAFREKSISTAVEKRGPLPGDAQCAVRAGARSHRHRRRADDRAQLAASARMAVAKSPPHSAKTASGAVAAAGLRPRRRGVVSLNIAILGTRGVPPRYGGFETFAAELGTRLVRRGHRVAVYCRVEGEKTWNGIQRIVLPSIPHKYFETVSHAFLSALDAMQQDFDVVLLCNAANAFVLPLLRAARIPTAINVDGIERHRRKWNAV